MHCVYIFWSGNVRVWSPEKEIGPARIRKPRVPSTKSPLSSPSLFPLRLSLIPCLCITVFINHFHEFDIIFILCNMITDTLFLLILFSKSSNVQCIEILINLLSTLRKKTFFIFIFSSDARQCCYGSVGWKTLCCGSLAIPSLSFPCQIKHIISEKCEKKTTVYDIWAMSVWNVLCFENS